MHDTRPDRLETDLGLDLLHGPPPGKARVAQVGIAARAVALPTVGER